MSASQAVVQRVDPAGTIRVAGKGLFLPGQPARRPQWGGASGGFHYSPVPGDVLVLVRASGVDVPVAYVASANPTDAAAQTSLQPGEVIVLGPAGSSIKLDASGNVAITTGPSGHMTVNGKNVALNGDTSTGTDPQGGTDTVTLAASGR